MKKYICIGKWRVWGFCDRNKWLVLNWTDDYTEALTAKENAEFENNAINTEYLIEQKITILEPLK